MLNFTALPTTRLMLIKYENGDPLKKVIAGVIDALMVACGLMFFFEPFSILGLFILYRLITIALFDSTFGMMLMNIVFLNAEQEPLNAMEKILASIFILYRGVDYYRRVQVK